jgi:asparagine N-glycosylation enzyme membrane subunit Stt3
MGLTVEVFWWVGVFGFSISGAVCTVQSVRMVLRKETSPYVQEILLVFLGTLLLAFSIPCIRKVAGFEPFPSTSTRQTTETIVKP